MTGRCDHGTCAKDLSGSQDRAHVVRITDPVQHHHNRACSLVPTRQRAPIAPIQRLHLNRSALVNGSRIQRHRELAGIGDLCLQPARFNRISQFGLRPFIQGITVPRILDVGVELSNRMSLERGSTNRIGQEM